MATKREMERARINAYIKGYHGKNNPYSITAKSLTWWAHREGEIDKERNVTADPEKVRNVPFRHKEPITGTKFDPNKVGIVTE